MKLLKSFVYVLLGATVTVGANAAKPVPNATMAELGKMVGGTWVGHVRTGDGDVTVKFHYHWMRDGGGVEGDGVIGPGTKTAMYIHSTLGWDPVAKRVYYCDFHGSDTAYFGYVTLEKGQLVFRFHALVGGPGEWESHVAFTGRNAYSSTLASVKDGKGTPVFHLALKREG